MPGVYQFSLDRLKEEVAEVVSLNIPAVILFGVPDHKDDALGSGAYAEDGHCTTGDPPN